MWQDYIIMIKLKKLKLYPIAKWHHSMVESDNRISRKTNPVVQKPIATADSVVHRCTRQVTELVYVLRRFNGLVCTLKQSI